jgi:hypothetical protein
MRAPFHPIVVERLIFTALAALQRRFSTPGAIIRMLDLDNSRLMVDELSEITTESALDTLSPLGFSQLVWGNLTWSQLLSFSWAAALPGT